MKVGSWNLGDIWQYTPVGDSDNPTPVPRMLSTSEAMVLPILQLIQKYYTFNGNKFNLDDQENSEMMIAGKYRYDYAEWGLKPTVIVMRGTITPENMGGLKSREHWNQQTGTMIYKRKYRSTVTIMCISANYAEAIATEIFDVLDMMPREVAAAGIFHMEGLVLGTEERVEGGAVPSLKMCQVSCNITTEKRWSETPKNTTVLQGVNINGLCGT